MAAVQIVLDARCGVAEGSFRDDRGGALRWVDITSARFGLSKEHLEREPQEVVLALDAGVAGTVSE